MTDNPTPPTPSTPEPGLTPNYLSPQQEVTPDAADVEKNKIFAILAYFGILFLVPLLAAKESPFARYHTNQGVILFLVAIISGFAIGIVSFIAGLIPFLGICIVCGLGIGHLAFVATFIVMGVINAANGRMKPLPFIGKYSLIK